ESGGFLVLGIFGKESQNFLFGKIIAQLAGGDGLCPAGGAVTETAAALGESDAMLLQELSREILKTGRLSQNGTDIFAQDGFLGFVFGLPDGQAGSCVLGVGVVEAALAASLRPILSFGDAVAGTFQQVDLVEASILAKLHDFGAEVPQHGRRTAVLAALLPVTGFLHMGLALDFADPQAANDNVNVDISSSIVAVRVSTDNGRMARKVLLAELQAEGLRLFQGQAVVSCVPGVKADDIMVRFYIAGIAILAVLPVC